VAVRALHVEGAPLVRCVGHVPRVAVGAV
jgi:hypothetical protein